MEKPNAVNDWELGLPNADDLTPLSHNLISPGLMSAFNIKPTPHRSPSDVTDASHTTLSGIISGAANFSGSGSGTGDGDVTGDGDIAGVGGGDEGSEAKVPRRNVSPEDADSKRARLVWTPQLHRRFVDVVAHLGIKNAVPKTIMQLMNVEGLTRENVASHLQKYRLYLKRNQHGGSGGVDFEPRPTPVQQQISGYGGGGGGGGYNNSNNYGNHNYQYGNGVMQTGNNNMFGYHHNHPNHGFAPHVAPGEK